MRLKKNLFSNRLVFRTLTKTDVGDQYLKWLRDKKITKFLEVRLQKQTKQTIRNNVNKHNCSSDSFLLGIFLKNQNLHIGNIKIYSISKYHKHCTIGILIGERQAHNQGYATESILRVSQFCKNNLNLKKISAGIYKNNIASRKAFQKAGFSVEAVQKRHRREGKKWVDSLLMAKKI